MGYALVPSAMTILSELLATVDNLADKRVVVVVNFAFVVSMVLCSRELLLTFFDRACVAA
jgi:hypothetical protein